MDTDIDTVTVLLKKSFQWPFLTSSEITTNIELFEMNNPGYGTFLNRSRDEEILAPNPNPDPRNTEFQSIWPYEFVQLWWHRPFNNNNEAEEEEELPAEALEVINFLLAMLIALFSMMTFATLLLFVVLQTEV